MKSIEQKIQEFFAHLAPPYFSESKKRALKNIVLSEYNDQISRSWKNTFLSFWEKKHFRFASVGTGFVLFFGLFSLFGQSSIAGSVEPKFGDIMLIQDGETRIIRERTVVRVGDIVLVPKDGEAQLTLSERIVSDLSSNTEARIIDKKNIYVAQGGATSQGLNEGGGRISTVRGTVFPEIGASFEVLVSKTGETKVSLKEKSAEIVDWMDGRMFLNAGEQINLRTDTQKLSYQEVPEIKLSFSQLEGIRAKLIIARTKLFRVLEKNPRKISSKDVASAEKTFRSIIQILKSDRQLNILKRTNSDLLKNEDVYLETKSRISDSNILNEIRATEELFSVYKKSNFGALSIPTKDSRFFNRFSLIDQIFENEKSQEFSEILKESYVQLLSQKIINTEDPVEQQEILLEEVQKIPETTLGKDFKKRLAIDIDPYFPGIFDRL